MAGFGVTVNPADLQEVDRMMRGIKNGYATVVSGAMNKAIVGVRTDTVAEIRKDITPKAKIIRNTITLKKASKARLSAAVRSKGGFLPLIHYQARATKKGVSAKIHKIGKRTLWPGAFIATMKSGHRGVFSREKPPYKTQASNKLPWKRFDAKYRLPIQELFGPRIPGIMGKDIVMRPILEKRGTGFIKNLTGD